MSGRRLNNYSLDDIVLLNQAAFLEPCKIEGRNVHGLERPIQAILFEKYTRLGIPTDPAIALAFLSGVLIPALIYELAIHRNPRLRPWFGFAAEEKATEVATTPAKPTSVG